MPKVSRGRNAKNYPYTQKGKKDARRYARETGQRVNSGPRMTNRDGSRRMPGSGGPRDVGFKPRRMRPRVGSVRGAAPSNRVKSPAMRRAANRIAKKNRY